MSSHAETEIRRAVAEGFQRIASALSKLAAVAPDYENLPIYTQGLANLKAEWSRVDDSFFADRSRVERFLSKIPPFADQIKAATEKYQVSFWDGFWESLGKRYVQLLDGLPTVKEALSAARWIVPALAVLALVVVFGPELKAALAAKRKGA